MCLIGSDRCWRNLFRRIGHRDRSHPGALYIVAVVIVGSIIVLVCNVRDLAVSGIGGDIRVAVGLAVVQVSVVLVPGNRFGVAMRCIAMIRIKRFA